MSYDFEYYSGKHLSYPTKPRKPSPPHRPIAIEARAWADALEEYEREMKSYDEDLSWYRRESGRLHTEFMDKLKKDYGLSDKPFDLIWSKAWERGHSAGLQEVYHEFDDLFEFLIKWSKVS
jgi:hypothetical protein